jgi:hypothetical protein
VVILDLDPLQFYLLRGVCSRHRLRNGSNRKKNEHHSFRQDIHDIPFMEVGSKQLATEYLIISFTHDDDGLEIRRVSQPICKIQEKLTTSGSI